MQERMIVATAVQTGVLAMMNTHVSSFDGQMYLQKAGGQIGPYYIICAVERITMSTWDGRNSSTITMSGLWQLTATWMTSDHS